MPKGKASLTKTRVVTRCQMPDDTTELERIITACVTDLLADVIIAMSPQQVLKWRLGNSQLTSDCSVSGVSKPRVSLVKDICYPGNRAFHSKATEWGCDREQTVRQQYCDLMSDMRIPPFRLFSGNIHIMWNLKMP